MTACREPGQDIFQPNGLIRLELLQASTTAALLASLREAQRTGWESVRSPHVFMGLLTIDHPQIHDWVHRLGTTPKQLLKEFADLFRRDCVQSCMVGRIHREFLSDSVIRILRHSWERAIAEQHPQITPLDVLISLFTTPNCVVAECFERVGVTASRLTNLAQQVEHQVPAN
jgi:ATP-dependent Clp protease ATP-binding subunit ClpA